MLRLNSSGPSSASGRLSPSSTSPAASSLGNSQPPQWKILLFDRLGQDVLAPVLNVKALREEGVTLHLLIHTERLLLFHCVEAPRILLVSLKLRQQRFHLVTDLDCRDAVPDVPAIYFCQPTEDNLRRIREDLANNLYGSYYFNFISPISRERLEDLATAAIQSNAVAQVAIAHTTFARLSHVA